MSIEKEGSGFPEVNVHRRTTKVNLSVIIGVLFFFVVAAGIAFWVSQQPNSPESTPPGPTHNR